MRNTRGVRAGWWLAFACWLVCHLLVVGGAANEPNARLRWGFELEHALRQAEQDQRPVLLVFEALWCSSCHRFREEALISPEVGQRLERLHLVRKDIDRAYSLARDLRVQAVPTVVLLAPDGREVSRAEGNLTAEELAAFLDAPPPNAGGVSEPLPSNYLPPHHNPDRKPVVWKGDSYRSRGICFAQVGYGPLSLGSQSPFQSLRFGLRPRKPSTLTRGQFEISASSTWANIWAFQVGNYLLDYETLNARAAVAYGVMDTLSVELEYDESRRFGGVMDGFIQEFHSLFGIGQGGRTHFPKERFHIELEPWYDEPGVAIGPNGRGIFTQSAMLTVQHNITCGTQHLPAMAYAVTGRYALMSEDVFNRYSFDGALSFTAAKRYGPLHLYAALSYAWLGDDSFRGVRLTSNQYAVLLAGEVRFAGRMAFIAQLLYSSGVARWREPFAFPAWEVTGGLKWEASDNTVLEVGLIENLVVHDNSPDFGVHLGITHRVREKVAKARRFR